MLGAPGVAPVQAPQLQPRVGFIRGVLDGFTADLADLYAALALGTVMLFVGWRVAVTVRRSARRSAAWRGGADDGRAATAVGAPIPAIGERKLVLDLGLDGDPAVRRLGARRRAVRSPCSSAGSASPGRA